MSIGGTLLSILSAPTRAAARAADYAELGVDSITDAAGFTTHAAADKFAAIETSDEVAAGTVANDPASIASQIDVIANGTGTGHGGSSADEDRQLTPPPGSPAGLLAQLRAFFNGLKTLGKVAVALVLGLLLFKLFSLFGDD